MDRYLLVLAAAMYLLVGLGHGLVILRELRRPRAPTLADRALQQAREEAGLGSSPLLADLLSGWFIFGFGHCLAVVLFGSLLLACAYPGLELFRADWRIPAAAIGASGIYLVLTLYFWFWKPAVGSGLATLFLLLAVFL